MPLKSDLTREWLPCAFREVAKNNKNRHTVPGVNCIYDCKTCGWNPIEQQRRIQKGHWAQTKDGKQQLKFPRRKEPF